MQCNVQQNHERKLSGLLTLEDWRDGLSLPLLLSSCPATAAGMRGEVEFRSLHGAAPLLILVGLRDEGLFGTTSPVLVLVLFRLGDFGFESACDARTTFCRLTA